MVQKDINDWYTGIDFYIKTILATSAYMMMNNIDTIVLLDRGARLAYIWIKKFFKAIWKKVNIYFIDPKLFSHLTSEEESRRKFEKWFSNASFFKKPDNGILLLDTCMHSGWSIETVKRLFTKDKFPNVKTGAIDFYPWWKWICKEPDFHIFEWRTCHAFFRDYTFQRVSEQTEDRLFWTLSTNDIEKYYSRKLRREMINVLGNSRFKEIAIKIWKQLQQSTDIL